MRWMAFGLALLAADVLTAAAPVSAAPAPAPTSDMFRGKTITYIVSTTPGGGYDTYGRLIARHLPKYLTGARVIVKNVPGAGNIIGANTIYASKPDGLTIGMFNTGLIYDQIRGRSGLQFDLAKFSWIGKAAVETRAVLISTKSPFKSFDDIVKSPTPVKFSTSGIGTASFIDTRILVDALHLNVQIVNNFTGNQGEMAMLRGEIAAQVGTVDTLEQFVKNGNGFFALAMTGAASELPNVPRVERYVNDERGKKLLGVLNAVSELGRLTAGPPGIPANILGIHRAALFAVMNDPAVRAEAEKLNLPIDPLPGDAVEAKVKAALAQPPETVAALKQAAGG